MNCVHIRHRWHGEVNSVPPSIILNHSLLRLFSVLKRVKNAKTTMAQARLSALSLLSIENEVVEGMDFEDIVHEFAYLKSRRKATE